VISDTLMKPKLLIGTNFLNNVEINIKKEKITIKKLQVNVVEEDLLPEIYKIDYIHETDSKIDLSHVTNIKQRNTIQELINNYIPIKSQETNIKMNILLKDNESVFQRARR